MHAAMSLYTDGMGINMVVLDCNAALEMATGSEDGLGLKALICKGETVIAPSLITYEIAHALRKYVRGNYLTSSKAQQVGWHAMGFIDRLIDDTDEWPERLSEGIRLNHSPYDMAYLLLAKKTGATLITLDRKLQNLCLQEHVECIYTDRHFGEE